MEVLNEQMVPKVRAGEAIVITFKLDPSKVALIRDYSGVREVYLETVILD